ncbi:MAG: hypothetical protein KF826_03620 [Xanthobacteraceae bacterium]|nr:hypothetical protein [Xanthobacteraceae bacterium]MCW5674967.1 hypothetical protein [Xanthobacteraceae bacterium]
MKRLLSVRRNRQILYAFGIAICAIIFWRYADPFYYGRGSTNEKLLTSAPPVFAFLFAILIFQEPE